MNSAWSWLIRHIFDAHLASHMVQVVIIIGFHPIDPGSSPGMGIPFVEPQNQQLLLFSPIISFLCNAHTQTKQRERTKANKKRTQAQNKNKNKNKNIFLNVYIYILLLYLGGFGFFLRLVVVLLWFVVFPKVKSKERRKPKLLLSLHSKCFFSVVAFARARPLESSKFQGFFFFSLSFFLLQNQINK